MAFMLYEHHNGNLINLNESYSLAGDNLIYRTWKQRGHPVNQGWHVSANDLIALHTNQTETYETRRLLIDFHPKASHRIGIIELLDIHIYTWGDADPPYAQWSPMMLRLRNVMYEEYVEDVTPAFRAQVLETLEAPSSDDDFVEFLYLNGTNLAWVWGRSGMTNAAFLENEARVYFRQFF